MIEIIIMILLFCILMYVYDVSQKLDVIIKNQLESIKVKKNK